MTSERTRSMLRHERKIWKSGAASLAGVDEAGRGPLAGPVVAAAVLVTPGFFISGVDDSKKLSPGRREELFERIMSEASGVGVGIVDHSVIDEVNILNATFRAMHQAIARLPVQPGYLLIDGNRFREESDGSPGARRIPFTTIVHGDGESFAIAAASIVAKVTRDRIMREYDRLYPGYGFGRHKGYPTLQHRQAITRLGLSPIHRRSFTFSRPHSRGS
jgi:ribonuclease HII